MSHVNEWYGHFLATRAIPIKRPIPNNAIDEGFAFVINDLHLQKIARNSKYRLAVYFYDETTAQLFGRPYHTPFIQAANVDSNNDSENSENTNKEKANRNTCRIHEELFFHCPRFENGGIYLLIEVIEDPKQFSTEQSTVAWGMLPVFPSNTPVMEYGSVPDEILRKNRIVLYTGSPKALAFSPQLDTPSVGLLECVLLAHEQLKAASDYIPDFCLVGAGDGIPGLGTDEKGQQLQHPIALPFETFSFEDISLSFGPHAENIEKLLLNDLNTEKIYKENLPPTSKQSNDLEVLERRLRIGVHNGYTFIADPLVVHLSSIDEQLKGTHSLRRKAKGLFSRSVTDLRSELNTLFVHSKVSISVPQDTRMTIVFALDYLIGQRILAGASLHTQSIVVCWGVWRAYDVLNENGRTNASVSLIGGPRPNPDESLCYKSLLHLYRRDDSIFIQSVPKITIQFHATCESMVAHESRPISSLHHGDTSRELSPLQGERIASRVDRPHKPSDESYDDNVGITDEQQLEEHIKLERQQESEKITEQLEREARVQHQLPPIQPKKSTIKKPRIECQKSIDELIDGHTEKIQLQHDPVYKLPMSIAKTSNLPRSVYGLIAKTPYAKILDRNGEQPELVDFRGQNIVDMKRELHDRLETNEVIFQFLAYKRFDLPNFIQSHKVFFTMQFYRFSELTSEELFLLPPDKRADPSVLVRTDVHGNHIEDAPGFTAKFIVDRNSSRTGEEDEFIQFLANGKVCIDVWDAISLLHVGTVYVPLKCLLRSGRESVQCIVQCPVVSSSLPSVGPSIRSLLYLRIANIGHPSSNQIDMVCSRTTAIVNRRLDRLGDEGPQSYRIRAKTLNHNSDSALQRFLQAQRIDVQQTYERIFNEENYSRIREWEMLKRTLPKTSRKESFKRFIFEEELEAYRKLRRENKAVKLLEAVFKGITLHHRIHPSLGECVFFEFILHNSYPEPINCIIEIDEPALSVITDKDTWEFYKRVNQIATPIEKNLFHTSTIEEGQPRIEVFLKPNEHLHIPFLYDDLKYVHSDEAPRLTDTKVIFRRWDTSDVMSILALTVEHRPYCLDSSLRFFWQRETNFERTIAIESLRSRIGSVQCTDPTIKVQIRNIGVEQQLHLSAYCGLPGTLRTFLVLLYGDRYRSRLLATWRVTIHSAERVDIRSTMGQLFKHQLTMPRTDGAALIELFSSSPAIQCLTPKPLLSDAKSPGTIIIGYEPHSTNSDVSLISAVDLSSQSLLMAWLVYSQAELPNITKQFEVRIPIEPGEEGVITKHLSISNRYSIPRSFRINISKPQLVQVTPTDVQNIPPGGAQSISLFFPNVVRKPMSVEVLLYILHMETGTEEETFSMLLSYF